MIQADPSVLVKGAIPGRLGARSFHALRSEVTDVITRLRTGAALNENEEVFYSGQVPGALDLSEPEAIETKLTVLEELFTGLGAGAAHSTASPTSPSQPRRRRFNPATGRIE